MIYQDAIQACEVKSAVVLQAETREDRRIGRPHLAPETVYIVRVAYRLGSSHFGDAVRCTTAAGRIRCEVWRRDGWTHVIEADAPESGSWCERGSWSEHEDSSYLDIEAVLPLVGMVLR